MTVWMFRRPPSAAVIYRNLGRGPFADISERMGSPVTDPKAGRGSAFADFDNDGGTCRSMRFTR